MRVETHDRHGNAVCGEDFMGGTICSDVPDHSGGCSALCQTCGGDWINETCTCFKRCTECGAAMWFDEYNLPREHVPHFCLDCQCQTENPLHDWGAVRGDVMIQCVRQGDHDGPHAFPPVQCTIKNCTKHHYVEPVTDEEIAEVFGLSLPLRRDTP